MRVDGNCRVAIFGAFRGICATPNLILLYHGQSLHRYAGPGWRVSLGVCRLFSLNLTVVTELWEANTVLN